MKPATISVRPLSNVWIMACTEKIKKGINVVLELDCREVHSEIM